MAALHYFAYGSNLHLGRFRQRVPSARVIAAAVLPGYQLRFHKHGADDSGKCTIARAADEVHGVVYAIAAAERPALDALEGGYDRCAVVVNGRTGAMQVFTYIARADMVDPTLLPYDWYKRYVLLGAQQQGLDGDYCRRIEAQPCICDPDAERAREHCEILSSE